VLISCWSAKGGSGTTVVAAALALLLARRTPAGALLVDLAGDAALVLGVQSSSGLGVADWLAAGDSVPADGLARLEVPAGSRLALVPRGVGSFAAGPGADALVHVLASDPRPVVVDCGRTGPVPGPGGDAALALVASAGHSLLVLRPCYIALQRALDAPVRPSAVVLLTEPDRSLTAGDIEAILGVPIAAEVPVDPAVARAVDAGLLASRLPRSLERGLRRAA
jgi:MinD-like ATPase involved in chromosome partitioning or flagellar assembly